MSSWAYVYIFNSEELHFKTIYFLIRNIAFLKMGCYYYFGLMLTALILCYKLYTGNPLMGTLANSEEPDQMQHYAAFHQGLHCLYLQRQKYIIIKKLLPLTPNTAHNG